MQSLPSYEKVANNLKKYFKPATTFEGLSNYITTSSYANGNLVRAGGRDSTNQVNTPGASAPSTSTSAASSY